DSDGGAVLTLDPSIEPTAQPRTYVVEATVTGADDQTVTATRRVVALPAFVLALKAPRFLEPGEDLVPEILVLGPDGEPVVDQEVTVRLLHRQWHSHLRASDFSDGVARYITDVVDEPVHEIEVRSAEDPLALPLPLAGGEPGVYVVEVEARDRLGRAQTVSVDLYAASGGEQPVAWERPRSRVFEIDTDAASYRPGDTARLVLRSPFQSARAMVVVEAPEGNRYRWVDVVGGEGTFDLPIEGHWAPRLPVHVALMRGRAGGGPRPGNAVDLGKPATLAATEWLKIEPREAQLEVSLEHPAESMPGREIDLTVRLKTPDGEPAAGEVTLWLVDRAVLALGREQRLDPLPDFLIPAFTHLEMRDTRDLVFGSLPYAEIPGGGVAGQERGVLDRQTVRKNFEPVPFFRTALQVDASGALTVRVPLPDNLTDFAVRAKALSGAQRFGVASSRLSVRLPVLVQPALPRFVRPGDRFEAAAVARVVSGAGGAGGVQIRVEGLELEEGALAGDPAGEARRDLTLSPSGPTRVAFGVSVPTPTWGDDEETDLRRKVRVTVGVERDQDGAGDAFEAALPILDDRRPVIERQIVLLKAGDAFGWPAAEAEDGGALFRPGTFRRQLLASTEAGVVRMASGLDALLEFPHGCTEQRVSKARALLAVAELRERLALPALRVGGGDLERGAGGLDETLDWIAQSTGEDGLVAFWPGGQGYVSLTAWTADFLAAAERGGFDVPAAVRAPIERALGRALRSDYSGFIAGESWSERVMALEALARLGRLEPAYGAELGRKADFLGAEALARLLTTLDLATGEVDERPELVERLWDSLIFQRRQGRLAYAGLREEGLGDPRILPSEVRVLASATRALALRDGSDPRLEALQEALVRLGTGDGWGSTQADAQALLALSELLEVRSSVPEARVEIAGWPEGPASLELGGAGEGAPAVAVWRGASAEALEV
ncbi:MAG: alpha-2-macroglobulin family protein, partial [Acidobacteriota bacterium]